MRSLIWIIFSLLILVLLTLFFGIWLNVQLLKNDFFLALLLSLPCILMAFHIKLVMGWSRGITLVTIAMLIGWLMETIGLKGGTFFGGQYVYLRSFLNIGQVPLEVVLYWAIFTYTGYWVSNLIFYWFGVSQPVNPDKLWRLLAFILVDGYVVTAIDFFMDPILVDEGRWAWLTGGPYFGVPWGNFVGWFVVTVMISSIFRTYEYFKINLSWPKKEPLLGLPLIGYFQLIFAMAILSLAKDMRDLTVVGVSLMLPPAIFGALGLKKYWLKK